MLAAVYTGYAQVPVANIVATPKFGCAPLAVSFTGSGTNSPTSWSWTFGGVPPNVSKSTSTFQNDAVQFNVPGTYIVKLVATNASGNSVPVTDTITVNPVPTADFNVDKMTGCFPTNVNFTNTSQPGAGGSITSFIWDFGDGNLDNTNYNTNHIYRTGGSFPVTLFVQNNFGCNGKAQVKSVNGAITLTGGVIPDFITNLASSCTLPVSATFTNQTIGPNAMSYSWDFGDGSGWSSTVPSPTFNYTVANTYNVKLAATSSQGCTDTLISQVKISASGNLSDFSGATTVCVNTLAKFLNTSSPPPSSATWDYGDGTGPHNSINGQVTYPATGTYSVTLTNTFSGCTGTVTKNITVVNPPATNFTATNVNSCTTPLTTQFKDQTVGATSWSWDFGDGFTSNLPNPSHTYSILMEVSLSHLPRPQQVAARIPLANQHL